VYARPLHEGKPLTFAVSGMLWKSSLIMFDRETRSLWSHITGKAVAGPLKGMRLTPVPAVHTTWGLWRANYPDTVVLEKARWSRRSPHPFEPDHVLGLVLEGEVVGFPFPELKQAPLAHPAVAGEPLLVVYIEPAATAVAFRREVSGRVLSFHRLARKGEVWQMEDRETGSAWNALTGEALAGPLAGAGLAPVPATQAYLSNWRELYPGGRMWRAD